jgi:peptidoglycan/LPS O-acetylase OafA/YrhL
MFVFWSFDRLAAVSLPMALPPTVLRAVIVLAVSTALAELSWRYIEAPSLQFRPSFALPAVVKSA